MISNDQEAAQELVDSVKLLTSKKEIPEAFKKQWEKNKKDDKDDDKKGDKKDDKEKSLPPWLKKKKAADEEAAQELVKVARLLISKKEVPEAFKEQWKNKDKDGDGKENEPKPDFLKDKEKKSSTRLASHGSFHRDGVKVYVDTAFMNHTRNILPGSEMKHLGFGEFYLDTPDGEIQFDRSRGKDFEGQSGRSHLLYDNQDGKLWKKLLKGMVSKGVAVEV